MSGPSPDDYAKAWKLFASALDATPADSYHHDHDEELGPFWSGNAPPPPKPGSPAYWLETGSLVREYLMLQAGADYDDTLRQGFVRWLKQSAAERGRYIHGDDMQRAALVDRFLKVAR